MRTGNVRALQLKRSAGRHGLPRGLTPNAVSVVRAGVYTRGIKALRFAAQSQRILRLSISSGVRASAEASASLCAAHCVEQQKRYADNETEELERARKANVPVVDSNRLHRLNGC